MGLLDSVIGGVLGQVLGGGRSGGRDGGPAGGAMSPIVKALLMLLLSKGASGGLGDILGGGRQPAPNPEPGHSGGAGPYGRDPGQDPGDIGGFDQQGGRQDGPSLPPGDFSDLSGMLDDPRDGARVPQAGNFSQEISTDLGGFDGLVDRFRRVGLGDVMESWIGHGDNRPVVPEDLGRALGPDAVGALQTQTGLGREALLGQLAELLPEVVSRLTPNGHAPDTEERHQW